MKLRIQWVENVSFLAETESSHALVMDGAPEGGGRNLGPRPMEVLLAGTGGCTAYDVVTILRKARQPISDCVVEIQADRAAQDPSPPLPLLPLLAGQNQQLGVGRQHLAHRVLKLPSRLSSLVLTPDGGNDGFLTALEVRRMRIPADLVVLSACETGRGKVVTGEGIVGLTRALMHAGAPRVICSLWKVDDEATRALMVAFYENWKTMPAATALKRAQEQVKSQEKWKHPYFWAAWQLWGLAE